MLTVSAIESNNRRRGGIYPMAEGAIAGSVAGYALKYLYPVTSQEKSTPEYKRVIREINDKKDLFGPENESYLKNIQSKGDLTLAQDTFVKLYDGMKEGDKVHFGPKKLRETLATLRRKDSASAQEFRRLLHEARDTSLQTIKRCVEGYNMATKNIRPTSFFLIGGAVVGAIIALVHDLLRTDVKQ